MAQPLAAGNGHNSGDPMTIDLPFTQSEYEKWCREYDSCDREVREAVAERRNLRSKIKGAAGKNGLKAFDLARRERELPGTDRIEIDSYKRKMLEWEGKPIGYEPNLPGFDMTDGAPPPSLFQLTEKEMERVEGHGYDMGKAGQPASRNPWNPGTAPHQAWLDAWVKGQGEKVATEIKRGPGRPRKDAPAEEAKPDGRRGRVLSEEQKAAMQAGRVAARQRKAGSNGEAAVHADEEPAPRHAEARRLGHENGLAGNYDNAARYPEGEVGHDDYILGHEEGTREREEKGQPLADSAGPLLH